MQVQLRLFLDWGIRFRKPYQVPERAQRPVSYASKQELEQAIFCRHHAQRAESDTPPAPPVRGGMAYAQNKRMRQESPPPASLRTDLEDK